MIQELPTSPGIEGILQKHRMPRIDERGQQTESGDRLQAHPIPHGDEARFGDGVQGIDFLVREGIDLDERQVLHNQFRLVVAQAGSLVSDGLIHPARDDDRNGLPPAHGNRTRDSVKEHPLGGSAAILEQRPTRHHDGCGGGLR